MSDLLPYNPLDKKNLGASVAEALLGRKAHRMDAIEAFNGAGIYAIYYTGAFSGYKRIAQQNSSGDLIAPIYVGKAIPAGARKGGTGLDSERTKALYNRLSEHADSIRSVANLKIADFQCRFLVVDDIWIPLGESLLIAKFSPIWNTRIDGFGNHDPGKGRYKGMRPRWDVLHPGRAWAEKCGTRPETAAQISDEISAYLAQSTPPRSAHFYAEEKRAKYGARGTPD